MKYFNLTSSWAMGCVVTALLLMSGHITEADPTDDFSISLAQSSSAGDHYLLMPEDQVAGVLFDRLDLFPRSQVRPLSKHVVRLCKHFRFDPAFVLSLIDVESGFRVKAVSPAGAVGLMQIMPATGRALLKNRDFWKTLPEEDQRYLRSLRSGRVPMERGLNEAFINITLGVTYLSFLRKHYGEGSPYVLPAYNVGPARMDELLSRKSFRPVSTRAYFYAVRRGMPTMRFYRAGEGRTYCP